MDCRLSRNFRSVPCWSIKKSKNGKNGKNGDGYISVKDTSKCIKIHRQEIRIYTNWKKVSSKFINENIKIYNNNPEESKNNLDLHIFNYVRMIHLIDEFSQSKK